MTEQDANYIKLEDLPQTWPGRAKHPWPEWAKIPPGMSIEVDCNGRDPEVVVRSLRQSIRIGVRNTEGLQATNRGGRVFIFRPAEPQP